MPDTTPLPTTTTEDAPPSGDGWRPDLGALRARLDDIDDQIHDLLMARARVVEGVARSGKAAAFRPGREASILRRLLARHSGQLPARTLVRMWREMLAGTTAMQAPVKIAVFDPSGALAWVAREHFGFLTPVAVHASVDAALDAVRQGQATAAVLPFPGKSTTWWSALTAASPKLYVIARLPFWPARPEGLPAADALVVATTAPDASEADLSLLKLSEPPDRARLADAGLTLHAVHGNVAEIEGMVTEHDKRLPANSIVLGGYAIPVAGDPA